MLNILKARIRQGYQAIRDIRGAAVHPQFRGLPAVSVGISAEDCSRCAALCPAKAIACGPARIDMGRCVFCGDCEKASQGAIRFTNFHKLAASSRERLIVDTSTTAENFQAGAVSSRREIHKIFGRSFKLRQVSAGGCNGCEMELNACGNVNFDMGRFGIDFVASPRHADAVVITGPVSVNMAAALEDTLLSTPEPRLVIAAGSCAISGGLFDGSEALDRSFFEKHKVDLYIPGCPVHPLTVINGILDLMGNASA
jgi:Ni,Fe-hydrogenase III small subunit